MTFHGGQETKMTRTKRERSGVALQDEIVDAIAAGGLAIPQSVVIRVGVGERGSFTGDLDGCLLLRDCEVKRDSEVLVAERDGLLSCLEPFKRCADDVDAGWQVLE